jgi:hypothetical protein
MPVISAAGCGLCGPGGISGPTQSDRLRLPRVSMCPPNVRSWHVLSGGPTGTEIHSDIIFPDFVNFTFLKTFNFVERQYLLELVKRINAVSHHL